MPKNTRKRVRDRDKIYMGRTLKKLQDVATVKQA